jgi:hypothetical protein
MTTIGQGVREIRIRDQHGAFRMIYVASAYLVVSAERYRLWFSHLRVG